MSVLNEDQYLSNAESDEDEMDWEEVPVPQHIPIEETVEEGPSTKPNIEITLKAGPKKGKDASKKKPTGIPHAERLMRIDCHKVHTVALLTNAWIRNKWLNDPLLHARLLSLTPMVLQNSLAMIHKSRIPEAAKRGHLFEMSITRLVEWWSETFFEVLPTGHLRSRTFDDVQAELIAKGMISDPNQNDKGKGKARQVEPDPYADDDDDMEIIRSEKSLMKHALQRFGSRDVSAQLFTALCRSLDIPARLVVSLQSVPWQASVGKPKPKSKPRDTKGKGKAVIQNDDDADDMEEVDIPGVQSSTSTPTKSKGKEKAKPVIRLRKSKSKASTPVPNRPLRPEDPTATPPVFWTEVFSRPDARWIPVDPIRGIVNKRKLFDPSIQSSSSPGGAAARRTRVDNRMTYVVAFEEDGYARDVTPRYAREYGAKVAKTQAGGKGREHWWENVLSVVTRPYRLNRDDLEDEELTSNQLTEKMPTTVAGFKDHPLYFLERHLHKDQVITPNAPELGKFRGEPVYPRGSVLSLKTAENWMRRGRVVRAGEQPMKWVKQRASTVNRKRELEILREAGTSADGNAEDVQQGLYAERQTELYQPAPVIDGVIPKNDFGNIDLYVPSMLPAGAAHVPHKGTAKIARQLGFDYAEAVTGFEFKKRRAFPVISGVVVAAENEEALLEAYWEAEHDAAQKEQAKRQQNAIKRWTRLVQGLRIRQRLQEQYASSGQPSHAAGKEADANSSQPDERRLIVAMQDVPQPGGFLTGADDVVQPYSLPRYQHVAFESPQPSPKSQVSRLRSSAATSMLDEAETPRLSTPITMETIGDDKDENEDMEPVLLPPQPAVVGVPKSMAELAAEAADNAARGSGASPQPTLQETNIDKDVSRANAGASQKPSGVIANGASKASPVPADSKTKMPVKQRRAPAKRKKAKDDLSESASDEEEAQRPQRKRAKAQAAAAPAPASDRVLRSRRGKTEAQLQQEREQEEAYRRAITH
ncbi:Rad4-domain-containing protein [Dentipellis sp. KUC8613]|nr:Rad4-domain-containing protein [Dentipellis sp. KUC8613]